MAAVWAHCKIKMTCEADEPKEDEDGMAQDGEPEKKGHGGCGHVQPNIRKEGLKLFLVYKKQKDEEEQLVGARAFAPVSTSYHLYCVCRSTSRTSACSRPAMCTTRSRRSPIAIFCSSASASSTQGPTG